MLVSDFDYDLPEELIAQNPPARRGESRLLVVGRSDLHVEHTRFDRLVNFLRSGDLLVTNNTRVFPARLLGHRVPSGGAVECLLLERVGGETPESWEALMHPGQKLKTGALVRFADGAGGHSLLAQIEQRKYFGKRIVKLWREDGGDVMEAVERIGHVPLPPYIKREDTADDRERYQTVYAREQGSVAAPTAGLHFTPELLAALERSGIERAEITLHVGYGTFSPVRVDEVEQHHVHEEPYTIHQAVAAAVNRALDEGRRVIAVGTTTARALEAAGASGRLTAGQNATDLFIYPGFRFQIISGLITNFHLPRSSLLMLVSAFAGRERVLAAYREAVERRYRFYSYGDAMLIL